jgi:hypothetical protein
MTTHKGVNAYICDVRPTGIYRTITRHLHVLRARRLQHPPRWCRWTVRGVGLGEAHE